MNESACKGAGTLPDYRNGEHGQTCVACGTWIRDDMTDNAFFGFAAGCERAQANDDDNNKEIDP